MVEKPRTPRAASIREHWAGITEAAHDAIAGKLDARKMAQLTEILERHEADLAPIVAPFVEHLLDDPATPEPVRALLSELAAPQHFTTALLIGIGVGGLISPLLGAIVAPIVQDITNRQWEANRVMPLPPSIAAAAVLKGVLTPGQGRDAVAPSGYDQNAFNIMWEASGNAVGPAEALLLLRRGQIGEDHFLDILKYSNMNPKFYDDALKLKYAPPGAGTVITGALKGHLSDGEARDKIAEAGIDPANYDWLHKSSGRPPGIMSMVGLWNRGYTSQAKVEQAVRQSDINNDYMAEVLALRYYHVPPRSIVPMLRSGSISEARARTLLSEHGVRPADQDAFILEATQHSSAGLKELSASQIARAYEEKLIPKADASARLAKLKYNATDAELLLDMADAAVAARTLSAATTRVHALYVSRRITRAEASADLSRIGQPAGAVTQLLTLWDEELVTETPHLSIAHWQGALHRTVITLTEFIQQCHLAGWTGIAVKVLAAGAFPPGKVPANVLALNPANL